MKTNRKNKKAFTLVEILVAMAISVMVVGFATSFFVETMRGHLSVNQRSNQALDITKFSQELIYHAGRSNQFFIYKTVRQVDRDAPDDQQLIDTISVAPDILRPAGDFIVFVYYEFPKPAGQEYYRIKKLVGYYLDPDISGIGGIKKLTIDLSKDFTTGGATLADQVAAYNVGADKTMVEQVMIDNWAVAKHAKTEDFKLVARGLFKSELSTDTSGEGRLFYYRDKLSLMVAGQLFGTSAVNSKNTHTDTFNFSVTPRS